MKRFMSLICVIALMLSLGNVALAADTTATVLRLESAEGTVTITNAAGRALTATSNMRLLNGYTITTGAASYAYVSLDSTKVVKLDALSSCTVRQQGNKLELLLASGNLFFNVTEPLDTNASLTIRTSTMATGIRGTSGLVWCDGIRQSGTRLYTGTVSVTTFGDADDVSALEVLQTAVITAGQEALSTHDTDTGETSLEILTNGEADYSGFELKAIEAESGLLQEIYDNNNTAITPPLFETVEQQLEDEQATQQEAQDDAESAQSSQTASDDAAQSDTVTPTTTSSSSSGGSGSSGNTTTDDGTVETYAELVSALAETGADVTLSTNITATDDITVDSDGALTVASGTTLDMGDNTLIVEGDLTVEGTVTGTGTVVQADDDGTTTDGFVDLSGGSIISSDTYSYSSAVTNAMDTTGYTANSFTLSNVSYADAETPALSLNGASCIIYSGTISSTVGSGVSITNGGYLGVTGGSIETSGTAVSVTDGKLYVIGGTVTSETVAIEAGASAIVSITGGLVESTGSSYAIVYDDDTLFTKWTLDSDSTTSIPTIRSAGNSSVWDVSTTLAAYYDVEEVEGYHYLVYDDGTSTTAVTIIPTDWSSVTNALTTYDSVTVDGDVTATTGLTLSSGKNLIISNNCALSMAAGVYIEVPTGASLQVNASSSITGSSLSESTVSPVLVSGGDVTVLGRVNSANSVAAITISDGTLAIGSETSTIASVYGSQGNALVITGGSVTIYGGSVFTNSTSSYVINDTSSTGFTIAGTLTTNGTDGDVFIYSQFREVVYSGEKIYEGDEFTVSGETYYYLTSYSSGATSSSTTVNPSAWTDVTSLLDDSNTNHYDSVTIRGNVTMDDNYTLPEGKTLIVAEDVTLDLGDYILTIDGGTVEVYGTISTVATAVTVTAGRMSVTEGTVSSQAATAIYVGETGTLDVYEIQNCTIKSTSETVVDFTVTGNIIEVSDIDDDGYYTLTSYTAAATT